MAGEDGDDVPRTEVAVSLAVDVRWIAVAVLKPGSRWVNPLLPYVGGGIWQ